MKRSEAIALILKTLADCNDDRREVRTAFHVAAAIYDYVADELSPAFGGPHIARMCTYIATVYCEWDRERCMNRVFDGRTTCECDWDRLCLRVVDAWTDSSNEGIDQADEWVIPVFLRRWEENSPPDRSRTFKLAAYVADSMVAERPIARADGRSWAIALAFAAACFSIPSERSANVNAVARATGTSLEGGIASAGKERWREAVRAVRKVLIDLRGAVKINSDV